jgi:CheY-like chemotaxis protein
MPGRVMKAHFEIPDGDRRHVVEDIDRRRLRDAKPEHRALLYGALVEEQVVSMQVDRNVERRLGRGHTADVIDVCMREENVLHFGVVIADGSKELVDFVAGVDDRRGSRAFAGDEESVFLKRWNRANFQDHDCRITSMILCVVDDLMFSVKISAAAKAARADVVFERTPQAVTERVRAERPSLVIFDLNSSRMAPIDTIRVIKSDPDLKSTRTLGYVSHVQADTIAAAREAGCDEVLARSAFSDRLAAILSSAS